MKGLGISYVDKGYGGYLKKKRFRVQEEYKDIMLVNICM